MKRRRDMRRLCQLLVHIAQSESVAARDRREVLTTQLRGHLEATSTVTPALMDLVTSARLAEINRLAAVLPTAEKAAESATGRWQTITRISDRLQREGQLLDRDIEERSAFTSLLDRIATRKSRDESLPSCAGEQCSEPD